MPQRPDPREIRGPNVVAAESKSLGGAAAADLLRRAEVGLQNGGRVVLDLLGVEYLDSEGLGAVAAILKKGGDRLAVAGFGPRLEGFLGRLPVARRPAVHPTIEAARLALCPTAGRIGPPLDFPLAI